VLAVASLVVPVLPGVAALVLAVTAIQRTRQAPTGTAGGRDLATVALALAGVGLLAWSGLGALAVVAQRQQPTGWQAATGTAGHAADPFSQVTAPAFSERPAAGQPARPRPKVAAGRIGDRLTAYDRTGFPALEITVSRVAFSTGDQFEQPEHGLFMGVLLTVRALIDEQDTPFFNSYALVGGHRYEEVLSDLKEFSPPLEPRLLDHGERASGWLVLDVPGRHGRLVVRDSLDERTLGTWSF
jgi:hypothetical protein